MVPDRWKRIEKVRKNVKTAGSIDVNIYDPEGRVFRSKKELVNYLEGNQLPYKIEEFCFIPKEVVLVEENKSQDATTTNLYLSLKGSLFSNNDVSNNDLRIEPEAYTASIEPLNDEFFF